MSMSKPKKNKELKERMTPSAEAEAVREEPQTEPAEQEITEEKNEPLTPEEEAQLEFFDELWERTEAFFDCMEAAADRIIEMLAGMSEENRRDCDEPDEAAAVS